MTKRRMLTWLMVLLPAILCFMVPLEGADKKDAPVVAEGKLVKVNYTLTVEGEVIDSSAQREPLEVRVGSGHVIPGFEKALMGMKAGEKKSFQVSPEEGYGPQRPEAVQEVPKDRLPADREPEVGMKLYTAGEGGQVITATIVEVKKDTVMLDFNHPLAGKTLNFDVEIVEIGD